MGSGRAVLELIHREREKNPESARKLFPPAELEVLPESMYDSTEDEKGEKTSDEDDGKQPSTSAAAAASSVTVLPSTSNSQTQTVQLPLTRRERALSSSSNESSTYMPTLPSSVFHAPSGTGATRAS